MKGLELAERYYLEYGAPMLQEQFPQLEGLLAVGLVGSGSECFGYDDTLSQDHDFEPGFCIFLPEESLVDRTTAFALERAYARLPAEFMGMERCKRGPVGGNRHGVLRISDFLLEKTGTPDGEFALRDWFFIPEQSLAEATNGKLFRDDTGLMTALRQKLSALPEPVRLKKLAGSLLLMGQAGQYNYPRCMARGETAAARLAVHEFVQNALHAAFLLEKKYLPYYKWSFRALRELAALHTLHQPLEELLAGGLSHAETLARIDTVTETVAAALQQCGLTALPSRELESQAYAVNQRISDAEIRNLHILYGV